MNKFDHAQYFNIDEAEKYQWYLDLMSETRDEAIKRLNTYCVVPYNHNNYTYLDENIIRWINNEKLIYTEFNFGGGRYGMKTYEIANFMVKAIIAGILNRKKVAIYAFRYLGSALGDLKDEINNALDRYGLNQSSSPKYFVNGEYIFSAQYNKPKWRFLDGSFITAQGLHKPNSSTITLKGLASAQGFDLAITFLEEANEFSNKDKQAMRAALRGAKKTIHFSAANPDDEEQPYIAYLNSNLEFDEKELKEKAYQFKKFIDPISNRGKVFQYSNWRANPFLHEGQVQEMLEMERDDKYQYRIWGIGMPGSLQDAIFSPYLKSYQKDFNGSQLIAGLDFGYGYTNASHPTALIISEYNSKLNRVHPIKEYIHSNNIDSFKNITQIYDEIIQTIIDLYKQYPYNRYKSDGLYVQADQGGLGGVLIDELNNRCQLIFDSDINGPVSSWLHFVPTNKMHWAIKERIEITISLLNKNKLTIDKNLTKGLYTQMKLIKWKKKTTLNNHNPPEMDDLNDDTWDALSYSLMPYYQDLLQFLLNKQVYQKKYQQLFKASDFKPDATRW